MFNVELVADSLNYPASFAFFDNDILVLEKRNIYHFDLNENRTAMKLDGIIEGNGPVIDIQVGPDGYLYFVSLDLNVSDCDSHAPGCLVDHKIKGSIYKIVSP